MNAVAALALPPSQRRYSDPRERLRAHSKRSEQTFYGGRPCLLWQGPVNNYGYGTFSMRVPGHSTPRRIFVHRYAIFLFHGIALAKIDFAMHLCNVKRCWCPEHLKNGTQSENERYKHETRSMPFDRDGRRIELDRIDWHEPSLVVASREPGEDDE